MREDCTALGLAPAYGEQLKALGGGVNQTWRILQYRGISAYKCVGVSRSENSLLLEILDCINHILPFLPWLRFGLLFRPLLSVPT